MKGEKYAASTPQRQRHNFYRVKIKAINRGDRKPLTPAWPWRWVLRNFPLGIKCINFWHRYWEWEWLFILKKKKIYPLEPPKSKFQTSCQKSCVNHVTRFSAKKINGRANGIINKNTNDKKKNDQWSKFCIFISTLTVFSSNIPIACM